MEVSRTFSPVYNNRTLIFGRHVAVLNRVCIPAFGTALLKLGIKVGVSFGNVWGKP